MHLHQKMQHQPRRPQILPAQGREVNPLHTPAHIWADSLAIFKKIHPSLPWSEVHIQQHYYTQLRDHSLKSDLPNYEAAAQVCEVQMQQPLLLMQRKARDQGTSLFCWDHVIRCWTQNPDFQRRHTKCSSNLGSLYIYVYIEEMGYPTKRSVTAP